jgi:hypothetical protein
MSDTATFTRAVVAFFRARPLEWVPAIALETVGGRQAWRTRVSNARKAPYRLDIQNRTRMVTRPDGTRYKLSEYRYVPQPAPLAMPTRQAELLL